ncbi:hypothetical protein BHM03_00004095 [Ensete ventricosum]|uniref:sucrose synthase n=1 Tax=Ensete ventricosum TaxID=4639 RepID=A0A426YYV3_ENSVE|nr:hypothetical protein B296_00001361 [Ensete ventricosum]RZR78675.1 hypothetical protein BHM03_00004095 [Ensete ventricosum]
MNGRWGGMHDFAAIMSLNLKVLLRFGSYTWKIYATKVLNMGSIYGFWRQLNKEEKQAKQRYVKLFYNLQFRNLAKTVPAVDSTSEPVPVSSKPLTRPSSQITRRQALPLFPEIFA